MSAPPGEDHRRPLRQRGFIIAAVFVGLVLIAGILLAVVPQRDASPEPGATAAPAPTPTSTDSPTTSDPGDSHCGLDPGDQTVPAQPPEGATWELFGTFAAPSIEGVGPGVVHDDGVRSCFAHSPTGALLAAINFWAMAAVDESHQADERLAADTPEREALKEQFESQGTQDRSAPFQVAGFQLRNVSDESVVVDLAVRTSDGLVGSLPNAMRWEDGDWKLVLPATGDPGLQQLPDLSGYVMWSGV